MRVLAILLIGAALFAYGVTRPSAPLAVKSSFAELSPVTTKPVEPSKAIRPEPKPQPARSAAPLSIVPPVQGQQTVRVAPSPQATQVASAPAAPSSPAPSNAKRTAEILTAATIAALIVAESRRAYHDRGKPCACPDDSMRNGRACGSRSAYSRPGGSSPLCYPTDVSEAMIRSFRSRVAER
jgi:hypothetical protein